MKFILRYRLLSWLVASVFFLAIIALLSPQQLPVVIYKLSLVSLAAVIGYHLDRALFPYASPGNFLATNWKLKPRNKSLAVRKSEPEHPVLQKYQLVFAAVILRRALIVFAVIIGVTMGL